MNELISEIEKYITVSPTLRTALIDNFEKVVFPKKGLFIQAGQVGIPLGYISKGILRCFFTNKDGEDITTEIFFAENFSD